MLKTLIKKIESVFTIPQWKIIIKVNRNWVVLKQPENVSRADPFILNKNNKTYILFEECGIYKRKGVIKIGELNLKDKILTNIKVILKKKYHLSFPFIMEYKDNIYLIPESHENKSIDLYKFIKFPNKIKKIKTLVNNIDAADSVLFKIKNLWWLFTNIKSKKENDFHCNNLSLFYSSNFLKEKFTAHRKNPVVLNPKFARNAGSIISKQKKNFRVSQNCKNFYGENINILEINKISKSIYVETFKKKYVLKKKNFGFHTLNMSRNLIVGDIKLKKFKNIKKIILNIMQIIFKKLKFLK